MGKGKYLLTERILRDGSLPKLAPHSTVGESQTGQPGMQGSVTGGAASPIPPECPDQTAQPPPARLAQAAPVASSPLDLGFGLV